MVAVVADDDCDDEDRSGRLSAGLLLRLQLLWDNICGLAWECWRCNVCVCTPITLPFGGNFCKSVSEYGEGV